MNAPRFACGFCIMLILFGAACLFWTALSDGFNRYILPRPAHGGTIDMQSLCAVARSIFDEAGHDERLAEKLARERGFTSRQIWAAKKFCKGA